MLSSTASAQYDEQLGAWYMYFFDYKAGESKFGVQGDIQFRNWDLGSDLEQLLLRGGLTYRPDGTKAKLTLGYGNITTGMRGESTLTTSESRIYQEALLPQKVGSRLSLTHRFRYEQRCVDGQDFRTRYRYNLFLTLPITSKDVEKGTLYASMYNELFINGQKEVGPTSAVSIFDRNRLYAAMGYAVSDKLKVQLGMMRQTLNAASKSQLQLSLHHNW
jgi:hypothetical protein